MTDKDDIFLRELFASPQIVDDGFSQRIVWKIRRQLWLERLTLPAAVIVGALFSVKPMAQLAEMLFRLSPVQHMLKVDLSVTGMPALLNTQNLILGGLVFLAGMLIYQIVED